MYSGADVCSAARVAVARYLAGASQAKRENPAERRMVGMMTMDLRRLSASSTENIDRLFPVDVFAILASFLFGIGSSSPSPVGGQSDIVFVSIKSVDTSLALVRQGELESDNKTVARQGSFDVVVPGRLVRFNAGERDCSIRPTIVHARLSDQSEVVADNSFRCVMRRVRFHLETDTLRRLATQPEQYLVECVCRSQSAGQGRRNAGAEREGNRPGISCPQPEGAQSPVTHRAKDVAFPVVAGADTATERKGRARAKGDLVPHRQGLDRMFIFAFRVDRIVIRFRLVNGRHFEDRVRAAYTLVAGDQPAGREGNPVGYVIENARLKWIRLPVRRHRAPIRHFERSQRRCLDFKCPAHGVLPEWTSRQQHGNVLQDPYRILRFPILICKGEPCPSARKDQELRVCRLVHRVLVAVLTVQLEFRHIRGGHFITAAAPLIGKCRKRHYRYLVMKTLRSHAGRQGLHGAGQRKYE